MGILNLFEFKKKNQEVNVEGIEKEVAELKEEVKQESEKISEEMHEPKEVPKKEKWIWVEGYKGTDNDMCCQPNGPDTRIQYKLNEKFICDGKIEMCKNGFHFCKELDDVFNYRVLDFGNRFFKVNGLVNEKEYNDMIVNKGKVYTNNFGEIRTNDSKLVAKAIILKEELMYENGLKKYIKLPMIESNADYCFCVRYTYGKLVEMKFLDEMKKIGFSDIYSKIQMDTIKYERELFKYLKQAKAYKEENISKDLMIYLLEKYKRELIN